MHLSRYEQSLADVDPHDLWLSDWERSYMAGLRIPQRRADWRLGRWTAKQAVTDVLQRPPGNLSQIEVRPDLSGSPEIFISGVPAGLSISLTHRDGTAACAVGQPGTQIGCDLELIEARTEAFVSDYFTGEEQKLLLSVPESDRATLVMLIWSAKESALKALRVGLREDTRSVSIDICNARECAPSESIAIHRPSGSRSEFWRPLRPTYNASTFRGWWSADGTFVRTLVVLGAAE